MANHNNYCFNFLLFTILEGSGETNHMSIMFIVFFHNFRNSTERPLSASSNDTFVLEMDLEKHYFNLGIYAAIVMSLVVASMIRTVYFFVLCMRASVNLHNSMFTRLVRAPTRFFDTNPVGE